MNMKMKTCGVFLLFILAIVLTGCGERSPSTNGDSGREPGAEPGAEPGIDLSGVSLNGAGASFPYPIYSMWAYEYEETTGLKINYQSVGSGAGISSIREGMVDFGASDAPLHVEELDEYGLIQFPMIIGGVVPVINVEGINPGDLKLSSDVFAGIYLGDITKWNDGAISSINPGVNLPDQPITVVHRADGSGTTWIFSNYLSAVSSRWADRVGIGKSLEWPVGTGGRGNEGIANLVSEIDGSIGYVEYAYALQNDMAYALLENRAGNFVAPTADAFMAAAAHADWENAPGYYMVLVDQPGDDTWPIVGASFILIYKEHEDQGKARAMLKFFDWCYRSGQESAANLDYIPIPENVVEMVEETWSESITAAGEKIW